MPPNQAAFGYRRLTAVKGVGAAFCVSSLDRERLSLESKLCVAPARAQRGETCLITL